MWWNHINNIFDEIFVRKLIISFQSCLLPQTIAKRLIFCPPQKDFLLFSEGFVHLGFLFLWRQYTKFLKMCYYLWCTFSYIILLNYIASSSLFIILLNVPWMCKSSTQDNFCIYLSLYSLCPCVLMSLLCLLAKIKYIFRQVKAILHLPFLKIQENVHAIIQVHHFRVIFYKLAIKTEKWENWTASMQPLKEWWVLC